MEAQPASHAEGIFDTREQAENAVQALHAAGFSPGQITLTARDSRGHRLAGPRVQFQRTAAGGAVKGSFVGSVLGTVAGLLLSLIPGLHMSLLALALLGGSGGAAAGCFIGPFLALAITERAAHKYVHDSGRGHTVVRVLTPDREAEARTIMVDQGAYDFSMSTN